MEKKFRLLTLFSVVAVVALISLIGFAYFNQLNLNHSQEIRLKSLHAANELKASSEELTRLARTYVVTADAKYEKEYWEVIDVRSGKKERPDGRKVALLDIMKELGFTEEEFSKLKTAQENSSDLVKTETIAMNAVKGLYAAADGSFTKQDKPDLEMARKIMHDDKYHADKEKIMKPIAEFEMLLNARTDATVNHFIFLGNMLLIAIGILACMLAVTMVWSNKTTRKFILDISLRIAEYADQVSEGSNELNSISVSLSQATVEQSSSLQETSSAIQQTSSMVVKNTENAKQAAETSAQSLSYTNEGKAAVEKMIQSIDDISRSNELIVSQVDHSNQQMEAITTMIKEIGEKTKVINDIVFQTKLLSFNASVEAARAGENGKGFAVVAEEVGNLAAMSGRSAKEISDLLEGSIRRVESIVAETRTAVQSSIAEGKEKVKSGVSTAKTCEGILNQIITNVTDVSRMAAEISGASQEQSQGIGEITKAIEQLDSATQQNAASSEKTAHASGELAHQATSLKNTVHELVQTITGKAI